MNAPVMNIPVEALDISSRMTGFTDGLLYVLDVLSRSKNDPECPHDVRRFIEALLHSAEHSRCDVIGTYFQSITTEQSPRNIIH